MRGNLPWQGVKIADKKQKYEMIKQKKTEIGVEDLCEGLPEEFIQFLQKVRAIQFDERPDYDNLRAIFKELFYKNGLEFDYNYDWIKK